MKEIYLTFEWDSNKNKLNILKHDISFIEASSCFEDMNSIILEDTEHSKNEQRFYLLGLSKNAKLLVVIYCEIDEFETIRIISARKATKNEAKQYALSNVKNYEKY